MASERAVNYVIWHHLTHKKELDYLAERWSRTYPNDAITVSEAEGFVKEVLRLGAEGIKSIYAVRMVAGTMEKPKLKVVKKLKLPPKKKAAKRK